MQDTNVEVQDIPFTSRWKIGDSVSVMVNDDTEIIGIVSGVAFTISKVFYDVQFKHLVIPNIDSALVQPIQIPAED